LDEILLSELGLVDAELEGGVADEPLDQVAGLGDPERAPIRDTAGRLVGVVAVRRDVRRGDVIGAGDDVKQPGLELGGLRVGEEGAIVAVEVDSQGQHLAVLVDGQVTGHVVVACEPRGDEVLGAVLDPLHGPAEQQAGRGRDDVTGINGHLVAEAAA